MVRCWRIQVPSFGQPNRTDRHPEYAGRLFVIASCPDVCVGQFGAHDWIALADIFALGMILGSLATRLDFTKRGELQRFLTCRRNVHAVNPRIHPVVSRLIAHIKREDRAQDLAAIIETLDHYRRAETDDFELRFSAVAADHLVIEEAERPPPGWQR